MASKVLNLKRRRFSGVGGRGQIEKMAARVQSRHQMSAAHLESKVGGGLGGG